jgi:hypothetical protein
MRIINQSRLPDAEVAELVRFAFKGVADAGIVVKVKNRTAGAVSGRAYQSVPYQSPQYGQATAKMLVTIAIGPDSAFPADNIHVRSRLVRKIEVHGVDTQRGVNPYQKARETGETTGEGETYGGVHYSGNRCCAQVEVRVEERHPYGGKSSPLIEYHNWREGLVAVAAHESRHIHQFQLRARGKRAPLSEVDAEKHAAIRLAEYRERLAAKAAAPREMAGV